ncbi:unnamed protein product [Prorocentrum cordatum]|uniref:Uncharacterized protein n=1 Tax=Prorocentrum cordatum TaxID=2364126 RepID=A0ABN9WD59_9DINO|nr:unnamed protein product [Polarella glacialis]
MTGSCTSAWSSTTVRVSDIASVWEGERWCQPASTLAGLGINPVSMLSPPPLDSKTRPLVMTHAPSPRLPPWLPRLSSDRLQARLGTMRGRFEAALNAEARFNTRFDDAVECFNKDWRTCEAFSPVCATGTWEGGDVFFSFSSSAVH